MLFPSPSVQVPNQTPEIKEEAEIPISNEELIRAAESRYAIKYLYETLDCESGLDAKAVGDHGTSYGIAQIHLSAHPDVSKEEALDPAFAVEWAAKEFAAGHQTMWSCYNGDDPR